MRKNSIPIVVICSILILGLIIWNVYLMNKVDRMRKDQKELKLKNQMLEGDNDILTYDLVTARDSIRILKEK